jgi:hypothetical protein
MSRQSCRGAAGAFGFLGRQPARSGGCGNVLQNAGIAASYRTLSEIAKIARNAKIAKNETGKLCDVANENAKENA